MPGVLVAFSALPIANRRDLAARLRKGGVPGRVNGFVQFGVTNGQGDTVVTGLPSDRPRKFFPGFYMKEGIAFRRSSSGVGTTEIATGYMICGARIKIVGDTLASWSASIPGEFDTALDPGAFSDARKKWSHGADLVLVGAQTKSASAGGVVRLDSVLTHRGQHALRIPFLPYEEVSLREIDVSDIPEDPDLARITVRLLDPDGLPLEWPTKGYLYIRSAGTRKTPPSQSPRINIRPGRPYPVSPGDYVLASRHSLYRHVLPAEIVTLSKSEERVWEVRARSRLVRVQVTIRDASGAVCDHPRFLIKTHLGLAFFSTTSGKTELFLPEGRVELTAALPAYKSVERTVEVVPGMPAIELETSIK